MLFKEKLSETDIEDLKENAVHLETFANNMLSVLHQLEAKKSAAPISETLIWEFCKEEYGRLNFFVNDRLMPTLKKANKFLKKNNINEISIHESTVGIQEEASFELFILRYYLSLENLKAPLRQLKISPVKGFEFFDTLNYFHIKDIGEKIQLLSYYYVSDDTEKNTLNDMFRKETKKNTVTKIKHIHASYALDKITGFSMNPSERTKAYEFNFDVDDFKDVLNRIKNKTNNVVNFK